MDGTLQLRQITAKKDQLIYEIIFIGKMANIFNELGDAELNGLDDDGNPLIDFSDLDHEYNYGEIVNSWSNTDGYVYPMLDYGVNEPLYQQTSERIYKVNDFRPAVFLHDIIDRIFSFADFSYTSTFLSSAFFRKLIVPWTNEGFQLSESEVAARTATAISPGQPLRTEFAPNYPNPGFNQNVLLDFDSNIDPFDLWNDAGDYYEAPSDGWFNVTSVPSFTVERVSAPSGSNPVVTGQFNAVLNVYVQRVNGAVQLEQSFIVTIDIPASSTIGAT
ncbi:MAG: hypothetical protein ACYTE2_10675, partial [Planctomycetota bacterium]